MVTESLYELVSENLKALNYVLPENIIERMCSSIGCHIINLINLRYQRVFQGITLANYRQHLVLMSPSGYLKTTMLNGFLHPRYGMLKNSLIHTDVIATFSPESWAGTITKTDEGRAAVDGVFARNKQGILGADDYMKLKVLMEGSGIEHDEVYLMTALESDYMKKELSIGSLEVDNIGMTFWTGIRPTSLVMTSGLARRFMYQVYLPNQKDAKLFKKQSRLMFKKIAEDDKQKICDKIKDIYEKNTEFAAPNFDQVDSWVDTHMSVPHFEDKIYRRIALGCAISNDTFPDIHVDNNLAKLLQSEFEARRSIKFHPMPQIIRRCLEDVDTMDITTLTEFIMSHYQYSKAEVDIGIKSMVWEKQAILDGHQIMLKERYHKPLVTLSLNNNTK